MAPPILSVENLKVYFPVTRGVTRRSIGTLKAVDGVSFAINKGETFGLVGESGCGKTTTGKCVLGLLTPNSGRILYKGIDLAKATKAEAKALRRERQLIFQDPYGSLDPRQSAFSILREALTADGKHRAMSDVQNEVAGLLRTVELGPDMGRRYPHELSGGQRQRLGIARALACKPELIVCDEPVSALDVSIQAQIMNLFKSLQKTTGMSYLFIAHDLAVVRHISSHIGVMYLGNIVEITSSKHLYSKPLHPYTKALLSAIPITDYYQEQKRGRIVLRGDVPSPMNTPSGCPFHPRCSAASEPCRVIPPELRVVEAGHSVACHNV
jgi:oligopeptide/dipeptide ABC transporter ATP-binding protein